MLLLLSACLYISDGEVLGRLGDDTAIRDDTGGDDTGNGALVYADADGDGSGDPATALPEGEAPVGYVDNSWDCDDTDATEPVWADAAAGTDRSVGTMEDPFGLISDAITAAERCINVRGGTYMENLKLPGRSLSIVGVDGAKATFVTSAAKDAVVEITGAATVSLTGMTLMNGTGVTAGTDYTLGDGINIAYSSLTLTDVTLTNNEATSGGGLYASVSTVTLDGVWFQDNVAYDGAGFAQSSSTIQGEQVWIVGNEGEYATAANLFGGTTTLQDLVVNANRGNIGTDGILVDVGTLTLTNATFVDMDTALEFSTSTISLNGVAMTAVDRAMYGFNEVIVTMAWSTLYKAEVAAEYADGGGNLDEDPLFTALSEDGDWTNDTLTLQSGSPCIDAGDPSLADADGSRADMGARI